MLQRWMPPNSRLAALRRAFDAPVGVTRESRRVPRVDRTVARPRPSAEVGSVVIRKRLLQLRARIHHEWAVLRDRLSDRPSLQKEQFGVCGAGDKPYIGIWAEAHHGARRYRAILEAKRASANEVERAIGERGSSRDLP